MVTLVRFRRCIGLAASATLAGCGAPNISSLTPNTGPERTLVRVNGDTLLSSVRWDAGTPAEVGLSSGFLGASMFSVPAGAALGAHDVQLQRGSRRGNTKPFTVTAALPFGAPRLDRVSLAATTFPPPNKVNTWLIVQGANVDVGAEVLIDGVVQPTAAWKALTNDLLGVNPTDLNYPIYHHLALLAAPGERPAASTIAVSIRNADGQLSNVLNYALPANAATLDSDGDDIPDEWEINGYDADGDGVIDVDLPALGANPFRPDVFVEVDIMTGLNNPPAAATFNAVRAAFAAAPFINVGDNGINLVLDTSGTVPFSTTIDLDGADNPAAGFTNFYTLKAANFDNARRGRIYHYCIWARARPNGSSGISDPSINAAGTDFSGPGDDLIVSFDTFGASFQTVKSGAETFMHELGHNMMQRHGGVNHSTTTPVYNSVMSYSWQLRSGQSNATRRARPVYAPFYYGMNGVVEAGGAIPAGGPGTFVDFSDGMGRNLNEASLSEPVGLYNANAIDWNNDGDTLDTNVSRDVNGNGVPNELLVDFPNWARLDFRGPRLNGGHLP